MELFLKSCRVLLAIPIAAFPIAALPVPFAPIGPSQTYDMGFRCAVPFWSATDLNRDGVKDVVLGMTPTTSFTSESTPGALTIWMGQSDGSLTEQTQQMFSGNVTAAYNFTQLRTADLNGDGFPDIFVADSGVDTYANGVPVGPYLGSTPKLALSENGKLTDRSPTLNVLPAAFLHTSTLADVNNDGAIDAYVGSITASHDSKMPYLLMNNGGGVFTRNQSNLPNIVTVAGSAPTSLQADGSRIGGGQQYTGSIFLDHNNDGAPDLVLLPNNSTPDGIILTNDGKGDFTRVAPAKLPSGLWGNGSTRYATGANGNLTILQQRGTVWLDAVSTDLNDDGYLDLVSVQTVVDPAASIYYRGGRIQILINQQGKGFQDETAQRGSPGFDTFNNYDSYHGTLTVFDINGDGAMDLIAVRTTLGRYENHIFLNDGNGSFKRAEVQGLPSYGFIVPLSDRPNEPIRVGHFDPVSDRLVSTPGGTVGACTMAVQAYQSSIQTRPVVSAAKDQCLFNWAESQYPTLFSPPNGVTLTAGPYRYRHYARAGSYLGTSSDDKRLYYVGPASQGRVLDLGFAGTWYAASVCNQQ